ncbi:hypothetical protein HYZ64_02110, partial [Candidatus Berkelbacteria bacterium]|nr:hypothetical protein [Candidatus Berkelbacteria bacterium]
YALKHFSFEFDSKDISEILGGALVTLVTLMAFFAVIALFRLEGLRDKGDQESLSKSKDIKMQLSIVCSTIACAVFVGFFLLLWSASNKNSLLPDNKVIVSALIGLSSYIFSAILSFVYKENL